MALLTRAVFGVVMYLFNFYGMVHFFSWFADMRSWATVFAHVVFGMVVAVMYWELEQVRQQRKSVIARAINHGLE